MAEMKDMCKLVRYVDSDKYENARAGKVVNDKQAMHELVNLYAARGYILKHLRRRSKNKIGGVMYDAFQHNYIVVSEIEDSKHFSNVAIDTTTKGRHFIAKKWFIYPAGLVDDSLKAYGRSQRFYLGLLGGGGIGAVIAASVTYWLSH